MQEEGGLIGQLGINWKLLLSQAVNFFILLVILRAFVYKPLLKAIKKRNDRIKEGLEKAQIADTRLKEVDIIAKNKLKVAEGEAMVIIKNTEEKAKQLEHALQQKAEDKQKALLAQIQSAYEKQKEESERMVAKQAVELVKKFIVKTVELKPDLIDEALIGKAASQLKKHEA